MGTPMLYVDLLDPDKNFIGVLYSDDHFPRSSEVRFNIFWSEIRTQMCLLVPGRTYFRIYARPFFYEQY